MMWPLPSQPGVGQLAKEKKRENRARLHARPDRVELCGPTGSSKEPEHNPHAHSEHSPSPTCLCFSHTTSQAGERNQVSVAFSARRPQSYPKLAISEGPQVENQKVFIEGRTLSTGEPCLS